MMLNRTRNLRQGMALAVVLVVPGWLSGGVIEVGSPGELKAALAGAVAGDEIVIRNGRYRNAIWEVEAQGREGEPVRVRAETPGKVISTGQSALRISGRYVEVEGLLFTEGYLPGSGVVEFRSLDGRRMAEHSRVTQLAIVDYVPPNRSTRLFWVSIYGRNNRLDNSYFSGHDCNGVTVVVWLSKSDPAPVYHRIDSNHFADREEGGENGWETIRIADSETSMLDSFVTVENNLFTRCDGEIEVISNKSCSNIYRNNVFFETQGMLTLRHGDRCIVDGNYFLGNGRASTGGIRVMGRDHVVVNNYFERTTGRDGAAITVYPGVDGLNPPLNSYFSADRALIAFNTIIGVTGGSFIDMSTRYSQTYVVSPTDHRTISVLPEDVVVANNILVAGSSNATAFVTGREVTSHLFEGNVVSGRLLAGGPLPESGYRAAEPGFVQLDGLWQPPTDYALSGSAVGDYPVVMDDILGRLRTGPHDPGAFQVTGNASAEPQRTRPTLATTGPSWLDEDRDLRVVLWPLRPDFFTGSGSTLDGGWLQVDWLGRVFVNLFPWVYIESTDQWAYVEGPGRGIHWFHDTEWGWYATSAETYPYLFTNAGEWLYFHGLHQGQRIVSSVP